MSEPIEWAFGNIMNRPPMPQPHVREDIRRLFSKAARGFVLGCELGITRYDRAWHRFANYRRRKMKTFFVKQDLGIAVNPRFNVVRFVAYKMHGGKILTSPSRWLDGVFTVDTENDDLPVSVWVSHKVSGAWNKKKKRNKEWRKEKWLEHEKKESARLTEAVNKGWNVIVCEDNNRLEPGSYHPNQVLLGKSGIIHAIAIPANGYRVVQDGAWAESGTVKDRIVNGDHPFLYGAVKFVRTDR